MKVTVDLTPWYRGSLSEPGRLALGTARALLKKAQASDTRHFYFVSRDPRAGRDDPAHFSESVRRWSRLRRLFTGGRIYCAFTSELAPGRGDRIVYSVAPSEAALLETPDEKSLDTRSRRRRRAKFLKALKRADRIVVPTEWQRSRLMAWSRDFVARTYVVPPAPLLEHVPANLIQAPAAVSSFVLEERPFILAIGDLEPRSNLEFLIEVLSEVQNLDLVLMGRVRPGAEDLERRLEEFSARARVLRFTESDDAGLATLFDRARAVVVSSPGLVATLPIVEALVRGRPLLLARNPDHEELAGSAALFFDPNLGNAELKEFLEAVRDDSYVQRELGQRSAKRAEDFSWAKTTAKLVEVFESLSRPRKT